MITKPLVIPGRAYAPAGVAFRAWSLEDVPALVAAWEDPEMVRWMPEEAHPFGVEQARNFILDTARQLAERRVLGFAIAERETGRAVGSITFTLWSPRHWNIGYWVVPEHRGRGVASEAVTTLSRWALATYPEVERISLYTLPGNIASQRVAEHAGFRREGLLRRWAEVGGAMHDWVMYSLIRADLTDRAIG